MGKTEKLLSKLQNGSIDANELRTLFKRMGVTFHGAVGSHEKYSLEGRVMVLATHGKDLKAYQIKEARTLLGVRNG